MGKRAKTRYAAFVFVGHYAPSFALRQSGGVPLWVLFLAAQFVDVLWSIFIMTGIEQVRIVPGFTASSPLDLYYMPYTHSLTASVAWAVILGGLGSLVWKRRGGLAIGACVLAHWVLDLLVPVNALSGSRAGRDSIQCRAIRLST